MATKLRRCLYIGLGGTGMSAILHTKKMIQETYGEIPPMIGFLGIDTDGGEYTKTLDSPSGVISLMPNEQMSIVSPDALATYKKNKEKFNWMPEENEGSIVAMTIGAGQVRSCGRLATIMHNENISTALKTALDKIQAADGVQNPKYKLIANNVEIHMVFSICGGTGAGAFIDMAYLIKKIAPNCKLTAYAVLADVFESMIPSGPAMARVKPNAYGGIIDLDWLMHLTPSSTPFTLNYLKRTFSENQRPFNAVMFIDNKNTNHDVYSHVDALTEMISLALVTAAGELSVKTASVSDNIEKYYADGSMDIEDKKAWAAGLGVCEIVFKGRELADIYSIKAAQRLIYRMLNSCTDIDTIVNTWIDSPGVNIRENNNKDNVIDFILEKMPRVTLNRIEDTDAPKTEVEQYIASVKPKDSEINEKIQELSARTKEELTKLIKHHLNKECGVNDAKLIIQGIQAQVDIFLQEMNDELDGAEGFARMIPAKKQSVEIAISELSELSEKLFVINKARKMNELSEELFVATTNYVVNEREILRRRAAITFFTGLQNMLMLYAGYIQSIEEAFLKIERELTVELAEIQNRIGKKSHTFSINLASELYSAVSIADEDINITDFLNKIGLPNKIYDFAGKESSEIKEIVFSYTNNLKEAVRWAQKDIDHVVNGLSDDRFQQIIESAMQKALPLFQYDYQGYMPDTGMYQGYYIGLPDKNNSRLVKDNYFKNKLDGNTPVEFVPTGMKDRIIFYRQLGVVPAFAIAPVKTYEDKYNHCRLNCHFDNNILVRMAREGYSLYPKKQEDDTLELWVYGIIFGLVKREEDGYYYKSLTQGDPLLDYWVNLNTVYRDEAFERFKAERQSISLEFNRFIEEEEKNRGQAEMKNLKHDVKLHYYEKYSGMDLTIKELLKRKGYENIAKLVREEIDFVTKTL